MHYLHLYETDELVLINPGILKDNPCRLYDEVVRPLDINLVTIENILDIEPGCFVDSFDE